MSASDHSRIAAITLSSPRAGNRVDFALAYSLADRVEAARRDDEVWAVVLTAEGADFCAGTDADALREARAAGGGFALDALRVARLVAEIEKPVVCAIQGAAFEQGLEIALACDLRVADSTAVFRMSQAAVGAMPWDGGTQRLPRLIGRSRALEMLLTGAEVDAERALAWGLVNEVVEEGQAPARATRLAEEIARHGPIALRYLKEAVGAGMDGTLARGLGLEADLSVLLQSTRDRGEGIASFLERRRPEYRGE